MPKIAFLILLTVSAVPLWSQVEPSASGGGLELDDEHMMTPPPVSQNAYPVLVGSEARSNYWSGGMVVTTAYVDNLMLLNTTSPVSDETYTFSPTIGLDRRDPRQGESLFYSSGFTLYQHTSQLNAVTQNASANYHFHLSPYVILSLNDSFQQDDNFYNQGNPFSGGGVSGASGSTASPLIEPFANQIGNTTGGGIEYQYGRNAMIGANGSYTLLKYSQTPGTTGLNNENTTGGGAFFSRRIGPSQYVGLTYQFSKFVTHPIDTYTVSNTVFGFYTHYFTRSFSLSVLGGPEHYTSWVNQNAAPLPQDAVRQGAWTPAVQGSVGWQTLRTNLAASFSHVVSGAGGLIGTFHSDTANATARVMFTRRWSAGVNAEYTLFKNLSTGPTVLNEGYSGGHTISGGVSAQHRFADRLFGEVGYQHFHQDYGAIAVSNSFLGSNREYGSINYQFSRPIGR